MRKNLKKGSSVIVQGKISTKKYTDKQGIERAATGVVVTKLNGLLASMPPKNKDNNSESDVTGKESFDDIPF